MALARSQSEDTGYSNVGTALAAVEQLLRRAEEVSSRVLSVVLINPMTGLEPIERLGLTLKPLQLLAVDIETPFK